MLTIGTENKTIGIGLWKSMLFKFSKHYFEALEALVQ
jgi:hypothetical protein